MTLAWSTQSKALHKSTNNTLTDWRGVAHGLYARCVTYRPTFWTLLELRVMEMVVTARSTRRAKLQSNCYHQETNIQLSTGWMPFRSPKQQCLSSEGITSVNPWCSKIKNGLTLLYRLTQVVLGYRPLREVVCSVFLIVMFCLFLFYIDVGNNLQSKCTLTKARKVSQLSRYRT